MKGDARSRAISVLLIDDHQLFAAGLAKVLESCAGQVQFTVTLCTDGPSALALLDSIPAPRFDVMLVDLDLPDIGGLELLLAFQQRGVMTPVIVVSGTNNQQDVQRALDAGALGFIPKSSRSDDVAAAIDAVLAGDLYVPEGLWAVIDTVDAAQTALAGRPRGSVENISDRQIEVLRLLELGHSNQRIAEILNISVATVKTHLVALFRALDVNTRTECVRAARERALLG